MIEAAIGVLLLVVVLGLIYWALTIVVTHFGGPAFVTQILGIIFLLIIVLAIVRAVTTQAPIWKW